MSLHRNRVQMTVTGTPGTGTITLNAATSGYQSFGTAYSSADATVDILITEGTSWEVARNCTYTHSGTTVSRGTFEASSSGSAVSFTSAAIVSVIATAASGNNWGLNQIESNADAAVTGVVGTMHILDISGFTADRDFTLPATCAVGDRVGVALTAGDADYELLLKPDGSDTINGGSAGAEWSRLFITGEVVIFRCVTANSAWIVEYDGRIPQSAKMYLSTEADGETANTYTRPTAAATPGAWTDEFDNANLSTPASDRIKTRRNGTFIVTGSYAPKDAGVTGNYVNIELRKNGSTVLGGPSAVITASNVNRVFGALIVELVTDDYVDYYYRTQAGSIGAAITICTFALSEQL